MNRAVFFQQTITTWDLEAEEIEARPTPKWESVREFPTLSADHPPLGQLYAFVAAIEPRDIAANTRAAAATAAANVRADHRLFVKGQDRVIFEEVSSIEEFIKVFGEIDAIADTENLQVRQLEIFSHGGTDGPIFGENRRQFDIDGGPALSSLPLPDYAEDAVVFFRGCRVGAEGFLEKFAKQQNVRTFGFIGATSFSTDPSKFEAWERGTPAYQLDFPGSETWSRFIGRNPRATLPRGVVRRPR